MDLIGGKLLVRNQVEQLDLTKTSSSRTWRRCGENSEKEYKKQVLRLRKRLKNSNKKGAAALTLVHGNLDLVRVKAVDQTTNTNHSSKGSLKALVILRKETRESLFMGCF